MQQRPTRHHIGGQVSVQEDHHVAPTDILQADRIIHELRQPLQSLVLLHALLAKRLEGHAARDLMVRIDATLDVMIATLSGIERGTGTVVPGRAEHGSAVAATADEGLGFAPATSVIVASMTATKPTVFVIDDDEDVRHAFRSVLEDAGHAVLDFASCEEFLAGDTAEADGCLLIDAYLPGMGGVELLQRLQLSTSRLAAIMITGASDVPTAVQAMKAGAIDFIEKPVSRTDLLRSLAAAAEHGLGRSTIEAWRKDAIEKLARLTVRQRDIMDRVLDGHPSKNIAADLGISQRTVESHRASIMRKTGAASIPELARLAVAAISGDMTPSVSTVGISVDGSPASSA